MEKQTTTHCTYVIERHYPATLERVFAALADPAKKRRWFAEAASRDVQNFQMDFRVGGVETSSSRFKPGTPFAGTVLTNHTTYLDIVPGSRITFAYSMSFGDKPFSASLATMELSASDGGTTLVFTEQAAFFEGADGQQIREAGWRKLLALLAEEVAQPVAV